MKLNASLIIAVMLLLSGCGHLPNLTPDLSKILRKPKAKTNQEVPQNQPETQSSVEPSSPLEPSSPAKLPGAIETPSDSESLVIINDRSESVEATASADNNANPPAPVVYVEQDLLTRIRKGFRLPDIDSKYVDQQERWSSSHPTYIKNLFERAEPFLYYIVEEIEKRDLPMELALLPAVESSYKTNALSRSKAAGLWQFIPSTGRHFGLRQDYWYDGRRDLFASTQAALDYLTELNELFNGDWFLTLAAYNAGQGTILRSIKKNKRANRPTDYQSLNLRLETRRYVPKLIALKNLVANPEHYNIELPKIANKRNIISIKVPGQVDLKKFSHDTGIDYDSLKNLNGAHKRWATSPEGPHRLIVRLQDAYKADQASQQLASAPKINYQQHRIKRGESLSVIARKYGVTVNSIKVSNKLSNNNIREGRDLFIPIRGLPNARADQSIAASDNATWSNESKKLIHQVKKGDTLWSIARRYQVKIQELMSWNELSSTQVLSLNQRLLVFLN